MEFFSTLEIQRRISSLKAGGGSRNAVAFGRPLREQDFTHHDPNILRLNNGSFGSCPQQVMEVQTAIRNEWNRNPDDVWYTLPQRFNDAQKAVATQLMGDARVNDTFIVDNLTTAISILASSIIEKINTPNSVILTSNFTYSAVTKAMIHAKAQNPLAKDLEIVVVNIPFPIVPTGEVCPSEVIMEAYEKVLQELTREEEGEGEEGAAKPQKVAKNIAFAVVDHISSVPSYRMPVEDLVALLRSYDVQEILVDGAHAPGQIALNNDPETGIGGVTTMDCDYYVGNLHKWCMAPVSAAFLWVSPTAPSRGKLHFPIVSHSYNGGKHTDQTSSVSASAAAASASASVTVPKPIAGQSEASSESVWCALGDECAMLGTRDYASMLSVPAVFAYIQERFGGLAAMRERNTTLAHAAATMLGRAWGDYEQRTMKQLAGETSDASAKPSTVGYVAPKMLSSGMVMVGIPKVLGDNEQAAERLRVALRNWAPGEIRPVASSPRGDASGTGADADAEAGRGSLFNDALGDALGGVLTDTMGAITGAISGAMVGTDTTIIPAPREVTGGIIIQKLFPVKGDRLYLRLSAAVYNYMEEFEVLRDAVLELAVAEEAVRA